MKLIIIISLILMLFCGNALAWYDYDWDYRIPVEINNSGNPALDDYQFNVSFVSGINATSIRVVNDSSSTVIPHWCENVTGGLCYELWFNTSVGSEINNDHYIYYGNAVVASTSDYNNTFTKKYNDSELVLELHMDEGTSFSQTNDTSGEGNHGTLTNMNVTGNATSGWQGVDGGQWDNRSDIVFADGDHLRFDGGNDYIDCGNDESLNFGNGNFSLGFWFKTPDTDVGGRFIIQKETIVGGTDPGYNAFIVGGGGLRAVVCDGVNEVDIITTVAYDDDAWHYGSVVWESLSGTLRIYIDGQDVRHSTNAAVGDINSTFSTKIGGSSSQFFDGSTDEVRIYNRMLSGDEIYRQYIRSKYTADIPIVTASTYEMPKHVNISLHSSSPCCIFTNYTGVITGNYIVESNYPLNYSSLAFLMGVNYTPTSDMHSYLKVPSNSIASDGIYRAHNRNTTPYMTWENNTTITEDNVWQWSGGDNDSFWISKEIINDTHTWINMTGIASNVFPSMFYLGRQAIYAAPKTGIEINQHQGIIIKLFDLEGYRDRDNDYYISMYPDTQLESTTPTANIDIWYCNNSFAPLVDDPTTCPYCVRTDTWDYNRWMDHEDWQPHTNVSYAKPLTAYADTYPEILPDEVMYLYFSSDTLTSKSYVLNATNHDPGICNITYAQTNTMWTYNELSDTSTAIAYTPSFYATFVRDYEEFLHHLYIANDQGVWGHSDIYNISIGVSDVPPTYCHYNYYWWDNTIDYNMNGSYIDNFWINLTYGFDPDNGAALTHVLSLYDTDYNFVAFVNNSLEGNATDVDIFVDISDYNQGEYMFKIVSTDNEGSTSVAWSKEFTLVSKNSFWQSIKIIQGFPTAIGNILSTFISFLPLLVGILISGFILIVSVSVFSKFKRW